MLRRIWKKTLVRLCISWIFAATVGVIAIAAIVFNIFESIQFTGYPTNELERACLAAAVIMFDIVIITQVIILYVQSKLYMVCRKQLPL